MDLVVFYLDDAEVARTAKAVKWFCSELEGELADIALSRYLDKCTVTPAQASSARLCLASSQGVVGTCLLTLGL